MNLGQLIGEYIARVDRAQMTDEEVKAARKAEARMGKTQRSILDHLRANGPARLPEISNTVGVIQPNAQTALSGLLMRGLVVRHGTRRKYVYSIA